MKDRFICWIQIPSHRIFALALLCGLMALILFYLATRQAVWIEVAGERRQVWTHARTVQGALQSAGLEWQEQDELWPEPQAPLESGITIQFRPAVPIVLELPEGNQVVQSAAMSAANILAQQGLALYPGDTVWINGVPEKLVLNGDLPVQPDVLSLRKGLEIQLEIDGTRQVIHSTAATVGEALWESGITLYQGDQITPPAETPLQAGLEIEIQRTRPVRIFADGKWIQTRVAAENVGAALTQAGIPLLGLDFALPDATAPLPEDGEIHVVRVRDELEIEVEPLPFETAYEPLPDLEIDSQRLIEAGTYGVLARRVRVRFEDGQVTNRRAEGEWIAQEPTPQRVGYGADIVVRSLNTSDGTIQYWRAVTMYATSYSPSRAGVSPDSPTFGITASGKKLVKGLVAIDRSLIPFGTIMYVPGYGYAEAADTGGGVRGRWIDLGYDDDNWVSWHQNVTVYFLAPAPPESLITWIFP